MTEQAVRLLRVELVVSDLARAARFYVEALGFAADPARPLGAALLQRLGAERGEEVRLRRGAQVVALQRFEPAGAPYPEGCTAADAVFQHCAVVTPAIAAAYERLRPFAPVAISRGGPQRLPAASGGATAFKFRDPDGHPLELIEFADRHGGGIDHTAIAVAKAGRSIAFYQQRFGLRLQARQTNTGPEQDRLDGLDGVQVEVVALAPEAPTPHLELLAYVQPNGRANPAPRLTDIAATRTVLAVPGGPAELMQDPDGHWLMAEQDGS